jgi:hypothetical protein
MIFYLFHFFFIALFVLFSACTKPQDMPFTLPDNPLEYKYDMGNLEFHDGFHEGEIRGVLENKEIVEASGLAVSRNNPSLIWVHNDSGHPNWLYVVGENAEDFGTFIVRGAFNRDWEDIAAGPGPVDGVTYLYIGEIGDNLAQYDIMSVYRLPEPDISGLDSVANEFIDDVDRIDYVYPDGQSRDAETLMVDPWTRDLYIVSKRDEKSIVYIAPWPQSTEKVMTLTAVGIFPFNRALAGDISADGTEIVIKTDTRLYYWERKPGEAIYNALVKQPLLLPYILEPQGEAFGWMPDGSGYFTLSEKVFGIEPVLYYYGRRIPE